MTYEVVTADRTFGGYLNNTEYSGSTETSANICGRVSRHMQQLALPKIP